jgi:hypothetical protein
MKRRKRLVKAIRLTLSSLESHLDWMIERPSRRERKPPGASRKFHVRAGREYAKIVKVLLDELL